MLTLQSNKLINKLISNTLQLQIINRYQCKILINLIIFNKILMPITFKTKINNNLQLIIIFNRIVL